MRFFTDMGIGLDVASALRASSHVCVHLAEERLERLSDADIIVKARQERRVVLTHDLDFGRLLALSGAAGPSIVTFRLSDMRPSNVPDRLLRVLSDYSSDLERGAAFVVTDKGVRRRVLPIQSPQA